MNNEYIKLFLKQTNTKLTVFLPNIRNNDLFLHIEQRFEDGPQIKSFVIDAYRYFGNLKNEFGAKVKIYDFNFYPTYSFYRFDKTCILAMYPTSPKKQPVPTLRVSTMDDFGEFVNNDLKLLKTKRKPKTAIEIKQIIT